MEERVVRPADEVEQVVKTYGTMLFRICLLMLGSQGDAEDVVQNTFLQYMQKAPAFQNQEHEKAWLVKVATNQCKNVRRFWQAHPHSDLADVQLYVSDPESSGMMEALMQLPEKFRIVMLLYYVEQYRVEEIARIIGKTASAVKMRLCKGRKLLEEIYRKEYL